MESPVRDAYEALSSALEALLQATRDDDTDDDPGLITAWVIAVTSASIDEHGQRASLTEYRTSLDADLATCRGLYEMGADHCRRVLDD